MRAALILCLLIACDDDASSAMGDANVASDAVVADGATDVYEPGFVKANCLEDVECPVDQICAIPEGDITGCCEDGCRPGRCEPSEWCVIEPGAETGRCLPKSGEECLSPDSCVSEDECGGGPCEVELDQLCGYCAMASCPPGTELDPATRECRCVSDEGCAAGEICTEGRCEMPLDCCVSDDDCAPVEPNRRRECRPKQCECVEIFVCCSAENRCSEVGPDECEGQLILGADSCQHSPCDGAICEADAECEERRYCSVDDGRCLLGCRLEEDNCPGPSQYCTEARVCEEISCETDDDCPEELVCEPDWGLCVYE